MRRPLGPQEDGEMAETNDLAQASMPLCAFLDIRTEAASPEAAVLLMDWKPELCTAAGALHGGALMALADAAGAVCAYFNLPPGAAGTTTIQSSTSFLGAVRGGRLVARATAVHVGRTTVVVETEVRNDGRLVAKTTQTQAVLQAR